PVHGRLEHDRPAVVRGAVAAQRRTADRRPARRAARQRGTAAVARRAARGGDRLAPPPAAGLVAAASPRSSALGARPRFAPIALPCPLRPRLLRSPPPT